VALLLAGDSRDPPGIRHGHDLHVAQHVAEEVVQADDGGRAVVATGADAEPEAEARVGAFLGDVQVFEA
jgi:hypothetical protein